MQHLRSHREAALLQPEATQVATFAAFGHRLAAQADEEDEEMYKTLAKTLAVQVIIPPFHIAHPSPTPSGWCDPASQWCVPSPLAVQDVLETLLDAEVTHPPALLWVVCPPPLHGASPPPLPRQVTGLSLKQLRQLIEAAGLDGGGCVEKAELQVVMPLTVPLHVLIAPASSHPFWVVRWPPPHSGVPPVPPALLQTLAREAQTLLHNGGSAADVNRDELTAAGAIAADAALRRKQEAARIMRLEEQAASLPDPYPSPNPEPGPDPDPGPGPGPGPDPDQVAEKAAMAKEIEAFKAEAAKQQEERASAEAEARSKEAKLQRALRDAEGSAREEAKKAEITRQKLDAARKRALLNAANNGGGGGEMPAFGARSLDRSSARLLSDLRLTRCRPIVEQAPAASAAAARRPSTCWVVRPLPGCSTR